MSKPPIKIGKVGKNNSLFLALVAGGLLFWQSADINYSKSDGWTFETRPVPIQVSLPCFLVMAFSLGLNIREELMILMFAISRNSEAIAALAKQTNLELPSPEKETTEETTKEDPKNDADQGL